MNTVAVPFVTILLASGVFWAHHVAAFIILLRTLLGKVAGTRIRVDEIVVTSAGVVLLSLLHLEFVRLVAAGMGAWQAARRNANTVAKDE